MLKSSSESKAMNSTLLKGLLPYAGLPLLAAALLLRRHQLAAFTLLQYELLLVIGYLIAVKDSREKSIPNRLVLALLVCWLVTMVPQLAVDIERALALLKNAALGCALGGGLFLLVYLVSKNGLGGGDVKFMAAAGLYLGINGILPVILYGSIMASLYGLVMILLKKIERKDTIPLAPFLYLGILITIFIL